jgi:hypothetical protein
MQELGPEMGVFMASSKEKKRLLLRIVGLEFLLVTKLLSQFRHFLPQDLKRRILL